MKDLYLMRHGETEIEVNNDNTEDKYGRCNES